MPHVQYTSFRPSALLAPYVECYWNLKGAADGAVTAPELMLPDGRSELIFDLTSPHKTLGSSNTQETGRLSYFVGRSTRAISVQTPGNLNLLGISFRPYGAGPFFQPDQHELTDHVVTLDELWGSQARTIESQLHDAEAIAEKIAVLEQHLLKHLRCDSHRDNAIIVEAVYRIAKSQGTLRIGNLAESLGVTRRRLEKEFARSVGISPKLLARITRFQGIFYMMSDWVDFQWADAVVECGYFDQSHLIRDFQQFCGQSPSQYFERRHGIAENFRSVNRAAHSSNTI